MKNIGLLLVLLSVGTTYCIESKEVTVKKMLKKAASADFAGMKECIEKGVDVNARDENGKTALLWASYYGDIEVLKYLIKKGADIEAKDDKGNTPLTTTSYNGYLEHVKYLVENGADIDAKNKYGKTALMQASILGWLEVAQYLVAKGANIEAQDNIGRTSLSFVLSGGRGIRFSKVFCRKRCQRKRYNNC